MSIDEQAGSLAGQKTDAATQGNGAPPWLDHATSARFTHYDRLPLHAMVGLDDELTLVLDAHFIGCTPQRLRDLREGHRQAIAGAVGELLVDASFVADLRAFVGTTGDRIVVLGDSITADTLSWANLLDQCLDASPGTAAITVRNLAVSGFTTSETIPMFDLVVRERPTTVLAMLGTNDGRRQGRAADLRTVSTAETRRNLLGLQALTEQEVGARFVAISPPLMDQDRYDAATPADSPTRFSSEDLAETLDVLRDVFPDLVDLPRLTGRPDTDTFWLPDGLHPTLAGQVLLLRHIVGELARRSSGA